MNTSKRYSPEVRERAVRLMREHSRNNGWLPLRACYPIVAAAVRFPRRLPSGRVQDLIGRLHGSSIGVER